MKPGFAKQPWNIFLPCSYTRSGSASGMELLPRTAIALSFFEPITAPIPVRPACRPKSCETQAMLTLFSPAGPIRAI